MKKIIDYQAVETLSSFSLENAFPIPQAPFKIILASIQINIPAKATGNNKV